METETGAAAGPWIRVAALLLTAMTGGQGAVAEEPGLLLSCRHDSADSILSIICDRVAKEAPVIAGAYGYRVRMSDSDVTETDTGETDRALDIELSATAPPSQFAIKRIDAALRGRYPRTTVGPWSSELTAEGVARDLVHPVADAVLDRIEAFLSTPETG